MKNKITALVLIGLGFLVYVKLRKPKPTETTVPPNLTDPTSGSTSGGTSGGGNGTAGNTSEFIPTKGMWEGKRNASVANSRTGLAGKTNYAVVYTCKDGYTTKNAKQCKGRGTGDGIDSVKTF